VQSAGPVVQLLSAGVLLEDVSLEKVTSGSGPLAALAPAAGTRKPLDDRKVDKVCSVQENRVLKFIQDDSSVLHNNG
jgi:hypothetical protein